METANHYAHVVTASEAQAGVRYAAELTLLRYEKALRKIEGFSVDNNDRAALKMGEIAREALSPWRDNDEAQKLIDATKA